MICAASDNTEKKATEETQTVVLKQYGCEGSHALIVVGYGSMVGGPRRIQKSLLVLSFNICI